MGSLHPSLSQTPTTSGNFCQDTAYSLGWSTPTEVTCLALAAVEADVIFFFPLSFPLLVPLEHPSCDR